MDGIKKDAKIIAVAFGEVEKGIDSDDSLDVLLMFSKDPLSKLERLLVALQTVQKDVEYVARDIAKRKENIFVDNGGDLSARYEESRKKIEADSRLVADWKVNLDKMKKGLQEADEIIDNLGLGDDEPQIIEFLKKVADGKASVHDLTPEVLGWLTDKNMTTRLAVSFK